MMMSYEIYSGRMKSTTKTCHRIPRTNQICALLAIVLGLWTLFKTQSLTKDFFDPIAEACSSGGGASASSVVSGSIRTVTAGPLSPMNGLNLRQGVGHPDEEIEKEIDERILQENQGEHMDQSLVVGEEAVKVKDEEKEIETESEESIILSIGVGKKDIVKGYKLHPHEPWLGGSFVCLITQFLRELIQHSGGIFTFGIIASLSIITGLLMNVEADRSMYYHSNTPSIIRYPTILGILSQVLGISVVFPLIWVPSYCLVHSTAPTITTHAGVTGGVMDTASTGNVPCRSRVYAALITALLFPMLTLLVFNLDPDSYAWTFSAGLLGGPLVACSPMLLWFVMPSSRTTPTKFKIIARNNSNNNAHMNTMDINMTSNNNSTSKIKSNDPHHNKAEISHTLSTAYAIAGIVAFIGYGINIQLLIKAHGLDVSSVLDELWNSANPTVAFMTIDVSVLFVGVLLYIQVQNNGSKGVLKALLLLPFLGPGAACAYVLSMQEYHRVLSLEIDAEKDR